MLGWLTLIIGIILGFTDGWNIGLPVLLGAGVYFLISYFIFKSAEASLKKKAEKRGIDLNDSAEMARLERSGNKIPVYVFWMLPGIFVLGFGIVGVVGGQYGVAVTCAGLGLALLGKAKSEFKDR